MKKTLLFTVAIGCIALCSYLFVSCNKTTSKCQSCEEDGHRGLAFNYNIQSSNYSMKGYGNYSDLTEQCFAFMKTNPNEFNELLKSIEFDTKKNIHQGELTSVNLIVENQTNINKVVKKENILGLMLYYRNLNKLYTYTYLNKANEYSEMPEFSKESNIYSPKDVTNVFKILLKGNSYWSIINFLNFKALPEQAKETFEISSLQISIENLTKKTRMPSVDVCGGPCYQGPPKTYCSADPLTEVFSCKSTKTQDPPPICPMDQVIAVLESNNYDIIELNTEKNLLYNFRDNFLYNYSKGQAYIDDYYYIAEHFNNPSVQYSIAAQNLVKNKLP